MGERRSGSIEYRLTLPAGSYELASGYREWWGLSRNVVPSVTVEGETVTGEAIALSPQSPQGTSKIAFELDEPGTVLFRAARGTGTADPVLSWLAVAEVASAPSAPGDVAAAVSGSDVTVSWTAPADDGGSPITAYRVYAAGGDTALCEAPGGATSCVVTGLEAGSTAQFEVIAVTAVGESVRSAPSNEVAIPGGVDVSTVIGSRCVAGKVVQTVTVTNNGDVPVTVAATGAYGTKSFGAVQPGKSAAAAFSTRLAAVPAGVVTVTATATIDGKAMTVTDEVDAAAASCG